jgi:A/G-specific adenine glycosylase
LQSLAAAPLDEVLHLWSGLGYYARARNLHRAAQQLNTNSNGVIPRDIDALRQLPGIGRSTAAAILALAHGDRHAILDGNVKRVLSRHFGIEGYPGSAAVQKRLWVLAERCTPESRVGEYTQAIMDLGATLCSRGRPACLLCPLQVSCVARAENRQDRLPTPRPRRARPQRQAWVVLALRGENKVLLEHRQPAGIWGGLWALPEFPTRAHARQWCDEYLSGAGPLWRGEAISHAFSHFDYELQPLQVRCLGKAPGLRDDDRYRWYDVREPARIGLPRPIEVLLSRATGAAAVQWGR